jgi:anti-sigma factor RsiW
MKHWPNDSLMNAALGELTPAREAELRAHVEECAACREAFDHAESVSAALDGGLNSLVSGAPSANFESRLRTRLAAEPAPARISQFWPAWGPAMAAAFVVVALFLSVLISHLPRRASPPQEAHVADKTPAPPVVRAATPVTPSLPAVPPHSRVAHYAVRATPAPPAEPEVLVEPGQLAAALQFADAIRTGSVNASQLVVINEELSKPLAIKELQIAPLEKPHVDSNQSPKSAEDSSSR